MKLRMFVSETTGLIFFGDAKSPFGPGIGYPRLGSYATSIGCYPGQSVELAPVADMHEYLLLLRGIDTGNGDTVCDKCSGVGIRVYGDTSTWRMGAGGQAITSGICNACWGSGASNRPWADLRNLAPVRTCEWTQNDDGQWDTACGNCFEFTDGGPRENNFRGCPYCMGRIAEKGAPDAARKEEKN